MVNIILLHSLTLKFYGSKKNLNSYESTPYIFFPYCLFQLHKYTYMRVKKAMDECVWSLNPICNTCLLFGHGTTENTYSSSTYVGDGQFSGRDRGGVIATFMRIELSYCYFCWPTKQNKYMWQEYTMYVHIISIN